jgi:hypothetical protein
MMVDRDEQTIRQLADAASESGGARNDSMVLERSHRTGVDTEENRNGYGNG